MADQTSIFRLGSQTSAASLAVVVASDQAAIDVSAATVTVDSELAAAAAAADNFANPTTAPVLAFGMLWDGSTWDRMKGDSTDGVLVNLGSNNDVSVSGTVTVDLSTNNDVTTEFAGTTAVATMADDDANPDVLPIGAYLMGYDSSNTNWNRVEVDDAGHLQVDVLSGGGTDSPTTPANDYVTSASLAAGSSVDLDTADVGTQDLWQVEVWCSRPYRARLYTVENSVESTEPIAVGGADSFGSWTWTAPHRDFCAISTTAGTDAFRVEVTNLADSDAADVYATFHYSAS